jgi:zinc protease
MNLREDKHWSYGAHTMLAGARGQRPFVGYAPVQTDKTKDSMVELLKELRGVLGTRPITGEELAKAVTSQTLKLNGSWETAGRVAGTIGELVRFGLPDNHHTTYPDRVRALQLDDLARAAKTVVHPDKLIWVVVGDRAKIEAGIRELNYGELQLIDADGNPVAK